MENILDICGACPFFKQDKEKTFGWCKLLDEIAYKDQSCNRLGISEFMSPSMALRILHQYQKWRRGCKDRMASPYLIGEAIDEAIRILRTKDKDHEG